jgi:ribose/xylose/arabinose/galactoside ABC-type transport system permease subunit
MKTESGTVTTAERSPKGTFPRVRAFGSTYATELQLLVALGVLYAIFAFLKPSVFVTQTNAANMARIGGILLVVAVGQMFALVVGGFDLSVAVNMGFSATLMAYFVQLQGVPIEWGIVIGMAIGAGVGLVNGILIAVFRVNPLITTLGMATALLGLGFYPNGSKPFFGLPSSYALNFGVGDWGPFPVTIAIGGIVVAVVWLFFARLKAGLYIYAIGGNRDMCRLAGVPVIRYEVLAYTLCGLCAGLAGLMLGARIGIINGDIGYNSGYDLDSIATAVIGGALIGGGVGRISGVVLGVAVLTVLRTGLDIQGVSDFPQRMVTGGVLVGAVLLAQLRAGQLRDLTRMLPTSRARALAALQSLVPERRPT